MRCRWFSSGDSVRKRNRRLSHRNSKEITRNVLLVARPTIVGRSNISMNIMCSKPTPRSSSCSRPITFRKGPGVPSDHAGAISCSRFAIGEVLGWMGAGGLIELRVIKRPLGRRSARFVRSRNSSSHSGLEIVFRTFRKSDMSGLRPEQTRSTPAPASRAQFWWGVGSAWAKRGNRSVAGATFKESAGLCG